MPAESIRFLAPVLVARDFVTTVAFYRGGLGLDVRGDVPYAECRTPGSLFSIMDAGFLARGEFEMPGYAELGGAPATLLSFEVADLEGTFRRLAAARLAFLSPPSDRIPLGRKYALLRDPDGRTVMLMGPRTAPP